MQNTSVFRLISAAALAAVLFFPRMGQASSGKVAVPTPLSGESTTLFLPVVGNNFAAKYIGLYIKLTDVDTWNSEVDQFAAMTGAAHAVLLISSGYDCQDTPVRTVEQLRPRLDYIRAHGATPLIAWMPSNCGNGGFGDVNTLGLPDVLSGAWDAYMTQWATDIAALGYPVFVRWGHEMNIPSYSWAGQHAFGTDGRTDYDKVSESCGVTRCYLGGDDNLYDGPERFIAAYRHVHNLVAPIAPNIVWVWNPNGRNWPLASVAPWNDYSNYYPGDAYVDWVGVDAYNWGPLSGNGYSWTWATFDYMFRDVLADLAVRYPTKPQMIPEMSSVEDLGDPNRKAQWIRDAYQSAYYNYPLLKVVAWENEVVWDGAWSPDGTPQHVTGNWADFRVNTSPQALQAYQEAIGLWSSDAPLP